MTKKHYDVIIIGGGIIGCTLAFELARKGIKDILVLEKKYLTFGATGRCNAGYRRFWATDLFLDLVNPSIEIFKNINEYTGYTLNCEYVESGYVFPIYSEQMKEEFSRHIQFQNSRGIKSEMIDLASLKEIVPGICTDGVLGAAWSPKDGHLNPFHCTFAFAHGAQKLGVEISVKTEVKDVLVEHGVVKGVMTNRGVIFSNTIYNCTNTAVNTIAGMVGECLPITREFRQTMISERTGMLGGENKILPLVINMENGAWIKQTPEGQLMLGAAETETFSGDELKWDFMKKTAIYNTAMLPKIRNLCLLRQYGGEYDVSPDHAPIIHKSLQAEGMIHLCGFSGHGFMFAPEFAKIVADMHCGDKSSIPAETFRLERYEEGILLLDPLGV